jgi:hypothetical protein
MSNNIQEKVVVLDRSLPMLRLRDCRLIRATQQTSGPTEVPLDETGVEFDEDKIDRIELFYEDSPEATIRATVNRLLSDRDEGMGLV